MLNKVTKPIVLCADDYGQSASISNAILTLCEHRRITATTCLVNTPLWPKYAQKLLPWRDHIDIGLHFNLTEGPALSRHFRQRYGETLPKLRKLLRLSLLRKLNKAAIIEEFEAQIDRFKAEIGFLPDFIDGHQHVHQLPMVRDAFFSVYDRRFSQEKPYIRAVNFSVNMNDILFQPKKIVIFCLGSLPFKTLLENKGIPHNKSFSGIYSFTKKAAFSTLFPGFLQEVSANGLIMCHPGSEAKKEEDDISAARIEEYQYLLSKQFLKDCEAQEITLKRFRQMY